MNFISAFITLVLVMLTHATPPSENVARTTAPEEKDQLLNFTMMGSTEVSMTGETVCVKVSVEGFDAIVSMQYGIFFNPDIIQFREVRNFIIGGGDQSLIFGTRDVDQGIINFTWFADDIIQGLSLNDGTVIYELCFDVVGQDGQFSLVEFKDNPPRNVEITDDSGTEVEDVTLLPGRVNVGEVSSEGFTLSAPDLDVQMGEDICIPVSVQGFQNIISAQFSMNWDPSVIQFETINNFVFSEPIALTFNTTTAGEGRINFVWTTSANVENGETLDDGTTIFELCYNVIGDCETSTAFRFTDNPTPIEVVDRDNNVQLVIREDGRVNIGTCEFSLGTDVFHPCPGQTNGRIDLTVFGGTPPYQIQWTNGSTSEDLNNLGPGQYNVTVIDGESNMITLDQPVVLTDAAMQIDVDATEPSSAGASDGSIDITVSGGSPPYTYSWNNGVTTEDQSNLGEDIYQVTVTDANNCQVVSDNIILTLGVKIIDADVNNIICNGANDGSINLTVGGGTPGYTFAWSNGASTEDLNSLSSGSYSVTVTDASNETTTGGPYTIVNPTPIVITPTVTEVVDGGDGAIQIAVSGGVPPYQFQWNTGATTQNLSGLDAAEYTLTLTDAGGCVQMVTVPVPVEALRVMLDVTDVDCNGNATGSIAAIPENGIGPFSYTWSNGGTMDEITDLTVGSYSVTVEDASGKIFEGSANISEPLALNVTSEVELGTNGLGSASVSVSGGTPPYTYLWNDPTQHMGPSISNLAAGRYSVMVQDANGCQIIVDINVIEAECYEGRLLITPNGDGLNDELIILCAQDADKTSRLMIFNRYGELVYEQPNYDNQWRGTDNDNQELPDGVYYWVMEVTLSNADTRVFKGHVTLLRNLNN